MYELDFSTGPMFYFDRTTGKEFVQVMTTFTRYCKRFGFYLLATPTGPEPKVAYGTLMFADPRDEKEFEKATFTFFINPDLSIAFADPAPTLNPFGKLITAKEALDHPYFSDICLVITLAIQNEKVVIEYLRAGISAV